MFLSANWTKSKKREDLAKYVFSLVVLIERSDLDFYRAQVLYELRTFLALNNKKTYFEEAKQLIELILVQSKYF